MIDFGFMVRQHGTVILRPPKGWQISINVTELQLKVTPVLLHWEAAFTKTLNMLKACTGYV